MELILHLSDIHFNEETKNTNDEINLISNAIVSYFKGKEIDGIVFAITGDLTQRGSIEEFNLCAHFINKLKFSLAHRIENKSLKFSIISCPGNHDIYFDKPFSRNEYREMSIDSKIDFYTKSLENYYKSRFNPSNENNWMTYKKVIKYNGFNINFSCVNTTMGSLLDNFEVDKGIHSLPLSCFENLKTDVKDINILMMHHSKDWFNDEEWERFQDIEKKYYNVVLFGHEHFNRDNHIESNNKIVEEICGGELLGLKSIFNLITIDSNKKISFFKAIKINDCYEISKSGPEYRVSIDINNKEIYNSDFINELNDYSLIQDAKLNDIFVFPTLNYFNENSNDLRIDNFSSFEKILFDNDKKIVFISGDDLSGKSYLAKSLFLSFMDIYHPLLFTPNDFVGSSFENSIKRIISKEYNSNKISFSKYFQYSAGKIAIVDDFDCLDIEKSKKIKKILYEKFDKVILLKNQNNTNFIRSLVVDSSNDTFKSTNLTMTPMYYRKREQLINNICSFYYKNKSESEIQKISSIINESISKQLSILNLTPQFVVLCVNSMIKDGIQFGSSNGFTSVFYSNIIQQMQQSNCISKDDMDEYLYLLQNIAYKAHITREYPISINSIIEVVDNYNHEGNGVRPSVSALEFVKNLERTKMFQKSNLNVNKYIFVSSNYYSFFVAKNIVSLISDMKMDNTVLKKMINEMCFGVNGDILLYVSYILQSSTIIDLIFNQSKMFFNDFSIEADLNPKSCNIDYLRLKNTKLILEFPTIKDKNNSLKQREIDEEKVIDRKKDSVFYDYSEKDLDNSVMKIKQALKYIELLSRLLPDFMHLKSATSKEVVLGLYSYSNKLIYYVLKPYEELFEKDSKLLEELYKDADISTEFGDANRLKQAIQQISQDFILNVYYMIARLSSNNKTIYAFDNLCDRNMASNLVLDLMVHEKTEDLSKFSDLILNIDKKFDDIMIQNMLKRIVRHYCLNNSISYFGNNQRIINKYLVKYPSKNTVIQLRMNNKK